MNETFGFFFGDLIDLHQHMRIAFRFRYGTETGQAMMDDGVPVIFPGFVFIQIGTVIDGLADQLEVVDIKIAISHVYSQWVHSFSLTSGLV